tara:strand:+ start:456 stop:644 length:189 start_codon:yes stop_codon:yes gene_type:complete
MKKYIKILFISIVCLTTNLFSQKNNNGKIFDKHPGIDLVASFTKAYIEGDKKNYLQLYPMIS